MTQPLIRALYEGRTPAELLALLLDEPERKGYDIVREHWQTQGMQGDDFEPWCWAGLGLLDTEVKDGFLNGVDLEGNELPVAPGLNFNAAADWDILETELGQ